MTESGASPVVGSPFAITTTPTWSDGSHPSSEWYPGREPSCQ